jgi:hypothetical protein
MFRKYSRSNDCDVQLSAFYGIKPQPNIIRVPKAIFAPQTIRNTRHDLLNKGFRVRYVTQKWFSENP